MQHFCCSQRSSYVALDWFCLRWLVYNDRQSEWTTASRDSSAWEQMKADSDVRCEMRAGAGQQPSWGPGAMRPKALRGSWAQTFTSAAPRQTPEDRNKHSPGNHQRLADQTKQWKTQRQNKQNTAETKMLQTKPSWTALFRRQLQLIDSDDETISTFNPPGLLKLSFFLRVPINKIFINSQKTILLPVKKQQVIWLLFVWSKKKIIQLN